MKAENQPLGETLRQLILTLCSEEVIMLAGPRIPSVLLQGTVLAGSSCTDQAGHLPFSQLVLRATPVKKSIK